MGVLGEHNPITGTPCLKRDLDPAGKAYPLLLAPAWAPLFSFLPPASRAKELSRPSGKLGSREA